MQRQTKGPTRLTRSEKDRTPEESQVAYRSLEPHKNGWISSPPSLSGSTKSKPDSREFSGKTLRNLGI
ncbi:hypothetical protein B296_00042510 [Ensete ventricosum]|uniref:Uncharacterized protein n=1 Tax=Ensete ventricosum TaxID=4639 RepID=A0A426XKL2_ENSVE|nr:hypothetical protein B296_00042510 [Ensete ventricosum]